MSIQESIALVNSLPVSEAQKAAIIAQLILASPAPVAPAPQITNVSDLIIKPFVYDTTGAPRRSLRQEPGPNVYWFATDSRGGGYFVDKSVLDKPMPTDPKVTYDPYSGTGLLVALAEVSTDQEFRNRAYAKVRAEAGDKAQAFLENAAQADPTWNDALRKVLAGSSPEDAFASVQKGQNGLYSDPSFTLEQLKAAKVVAETV